MTDARATIRLPRELYADAQALATEAYGGNFSAVVRDAIETVVAAHTQGSTPEQAVADGGEHAPLTGHWPGADAHAVVAEPVAAADGAGCEAGQQGDTATCEYCGSETDRRYEFALEWPPEEECDPGRAALAFCGDCAAGIAADVLVDRAVTRDIGIYEELDSG